MISRFKFKIFAVVQGETHTARAREVAYLDEMLEIAHVAAEVQNHSCALDLLRHIVLPTPVVGGGGLILSRRDHIMRILFFEHEQDMPFGDDHLMQR